MKRSTIIFLIIIGLTAVIKPKSVDNVSSSQQKKLQTILSYQFCPHLLTQKIIAAKSKLSARKSLSKSEAQEVLKDLHKVAQKCPKTKARKNEILKLINSLHNDLTHISMKKAAKPAKTVAAQQMTNHYQNKLIVDKNIVFRPATSPDHSMNAVGSFTEGLRVLADSVPFKQTDSTKVITFVTPFHNKPIVVISLRYDDITFATPVVSNVSSTGFTVKGLSLPPPESNIGFIDYIAVGI